MYRLDAETLEPVGTPVNLAQQTVAVSAGLDGRFAIAVDRTGRFAVVDLVDGEVLHEGGLGLEPSSVELSPDGQRAVVVGIDAEVGVLDVENGEWVSPPVRAPRGSAAFASYTADGERVVAGGRNGVASLWDGRTGQLLASMVVDTTGVVRPTILEDGYTAMLTTPDGAAYAWDTRPESWIATACAIAGRNLTEDEWRDAFGDRPYRPSCPEP